MDPGKNSYRRYLDGDDKGMEEIILKYRDGLIFYLNQFVGSLELAEELAEEEDILFLGHIGIRLIILPDYRPGCVLISQLILLGCDLSLIDLPLVDRLRHGYRLVLLAIGKVLDELEFRFQAPDLLADLIL